MRGPLNRGPLNIPMNCASPPAPPAVRNPGLPDGPVGQEPLAGGGLGPLVLSRRSLHVLVQGAKLGNLEIYPMILNRHTGCLKLNLNERVVSRLGEHLQAAPARTTRG